MNLQLSTEKLNSNVLVVNAKGEVDLNTSNQLNETLTHLVNTGSSHLVLNLGGIKFIDSSGVAVIIATFRRIRQAAGSLTLISNNLNFKKLFSITNLTEHVKIFNTKEEALVAMR